MLGFGLGVLGELCCSITIIDSSDFSLKERLLECCLVRKKYLGGR